MADFIFSELEEFGFDNPHLENLYFDYKSKYLAGLQPDAKTYLYDQDENLRNLVLSITVTAHELSQKWDEKIEGLNISNRDTSRQDVSMSIYFFKLRKLKKMIEENQRDMENASYDEFITLNQIHNHLKTIERDITAQLGTVIMK